MEHNLFSLYQPIVDTRTLKRLGYEALSRGRPGSKSPEKLFRRAYEKGHIASLDLDCLGSAFQVLPKLGKKELLFVNVEPFTLSRCFAKGKEADPLLRKVASYGRRIVFELTEGMKTRDFAQIKRGTRFFRKYRCQFALDDIAGIGMKFFKLLTLKPEFIKIDISLVRGLRKGRLRKELVKRIVSLAHKTGALLVAEGVEQKRDVRLIREMGIQYAQGFYFSRPRRKPLRSS